MVNRVEIPELAYSVINVVYPPDNHLEFERFLYKHYHGCETDRFYLPVMWTACYVNHNYGQDKEYIQRLQEFIDSLDKTKKYWTCVQYDDGILNDISGIDLLQFNMSKQLGVQIPLLCQPHPYKFKSPKKWVASFVGSKTHPIRNELEKLKREDGYYVSFEPHDIETYCRILHESMFVICPRGYGSNSFRILEALQYGAIPIYLSDEYIMPFGTIPGWWLLANESNFKTVLSEAENLEPEQIIKMQDIGEKAYEEYYTYEGCFKYIIDYLEKENAPTP